MNFSLPPKRLKFENYLLLLFLDVYDSNNKDEFFLHLKSKIKDDMGYHHIEFITKKIAVLKTYLSKNPMPFSPSVTTRTLLSRKQAKGTLLL